MKKFINSLALMSMSFASVASAAAKCTVNGKEVDCPNVGGGFFAAIAGFMIIVWLIIIALGIFWIMMLIHAATNEIPDKSMWIIVLVFAGGLGAILYYFLVKKKMTIPKQAQAPAQPKSPTPPKPPQAPKA